MTTAKQLAYAASHDGEGAFFTYVTQQNFGEHLPLDGNAELDAMGIISRYVPGSEMVILVKETKPGGRVMLHTYRIRVELAYIQEGNGEVQ